MCVSESKKKANMEKCKESRKPGAEQWVYGFSVLSLQLWISNFKFKMVTKFLKIYALYFVTQLILKSIIW